MRSITEFHPGDEVVIRDWDDMMDEYGGSDDVITCRFSFVDSMRKFCGEEHIIKEIYDHKVYFQSPSSNMRGYNFSTDMIRHANDPEYGPVEEIPEPDPDQFFSIIN